MAACTTSSLLCLPVHSNHGGLQSCKPLLSPLQLGTPHQMSALGRLVARCAAQESSKVEQRPSQSRREFLGLGSLSVLSLVAVDQPVEEAIAADAECELTYGSSGLGFCDSTTGSGIEASKGMLIKANYIGKLENGKVFDSSYNRGKPLTFRVGVGEVIRGWDEGILGGDGIPPMLAGGRRTLRIPSQLGYGERGAGCRGGSCIIPPNSVLLFDVEFVGKV